MYVLHGVRKTYVLQNSPTVRSSESKLLATMMRQIYDAFGQYIFETCIISHHSLVTSHEGDYKNNNKNHVPARMKMMIILGIVLVPFSLMLFVLLLTYLLFYLLLKYIPRFFLSCALCFALVLLCPLLLVCSLVLPPICFVQDCTTTSPHVDHHSLPSSSQLDIRFSLGQGSCLGMTLFLPCHNISHFLTISPSKI